MGSSVQALGSGTSALKGVVVIIKMEVGEEGSTESDASRARCGGSGGGGRLKNIHLLTVLYC